MGKDDTNSAQEVLTFCPSFDGKYKAYVLNNKDNLRVVLSIHWQSVAVIFHSGPKPTAAYDSMVVATWTCANKNLFSPLILTSARSANKRLKKHMDKTREDEVVTNMGRGLQWKISTATAQSSLGGRK